MSDEVILDEALPDAARPARPSAAGKADGSGGSRRKWVVCAVIVALIIVLLVVLGIRSCSQGGDEFRLDPNAVQGQAPYKTAEEMQAELNRVVEEGMFNISIATEIAFADGSSPGTAYIENVPGNRYDMQVSIALDATGEEVYASGAIAPGSYLGDITLSQDPGPGEHAATATFVALDRETHEEAGRAAAKVTLVVEG